MGQAAPPFEALRVALARPSDARGARPTLAQGPQHAAAARGNSALNMRAVNAVRREMARGMGVR